MPNMEAEGNGPTKKEVQRSKEDHKEELKKIIVFLKMERVAKFINERERERELYPYFVCLE